MARRRIRLIVRYDGRDFAGSQYQAGKRTIAGTLKTELETQLDEPIRLDFASRTDRGVHADGNVCAFTAAPRFPSVVSAGAESAIAIDVQIRGADAAADFSPRSMPWPEATFTACIARQIFRRSRALRRGLRQRVERLGWRALRMLVGTHSFDAFSKTAAAMNASVPYFAPTDRARPRAIIMFTANRFLRHMIVRLAGRCWQPRPPEPDDRAGTDWPAAFKLKPAPARGLTWLAWLSGEFKT
jgi:tRNA pseudouridine38-40 synthase